MLKKMILLLAMVAVPLAGHAATVQLPRTGQVTCFSGTGTVIPCTAPEAAGQDAQLLKGVAWPSPRFTDNGNGTVTDGLTGLIWLKDPLCTTLGTTGRFQNWGQTFAAVQGLQNGQCGLTDGSATGAWRVPNVLELESLVDIGVEGPALPAGNPFLHTEETFWTSTTHAHFPANAWTINMVDGSVRGDQKILPAGISYLVWPVRGPQ